MKYISLILTFLSFNTYSLTGADALLGNLNVDQKEVQVGSKNSFKAFNLDDPFLAQLFTEWKTAGKLDYDVNQWVNKILTHDFKGAAHLISAISKKIPSSFEMTFKAAEVYLYYKLDLGQTFVNSWIRNIQDPSFIQNPAGLALSEYIGKSAFDKVFNIAPILNSEQLAFVENVPVETTNGMNLALKVFANLKSGIKAKELMERIPGTHPLKIPMARTLVISYAKMGEVGEAGKILKRHLEPAIVATKDLDLLRKHYLTVARLLYQVGMLDASRDFYLKVPNDTKDFLKAQTELAWVWLRKGDMSRLKGLLTSLEHDLFVDIFNPEIYLVRSIANLKLCQYQEVHKDFNAFISANKVWAKKITKATNESDPKAMDADDYYVRLYKRSLANLEAERNRLESLKKESIKAALPAVGVQPHWSEAASKVMASVEDQKKRVASEYRRFWKNREIVLKEAIRKMRFVKVETMSQLNQMMAETGKVTQTSGDTVSRVSSAVKKDKDIVFPFDGVIWSDEMFNLYAEAQNHCLGKNK